MAQAQLRLSFPALRALDELGRQRSLTEAARELAVTPSAVSQLLSTLERRVGVALVERGGARLQLTDAGRAYARVVRRAFRQIARATERLAAEQAPTAAPPLEAVAAVEPPQD